jgi:hypothetical protein
MVDNDELKNGLKSIGFKESMYPIYLKNSTNNSCLHVNIPETYSEIPFLPTTSESSFFRPASFDVILMFFKGITLDLCVNNINKHPLYISSHYNRTCDHCNISIVHRHDNHQNSAVLKDRSYYYCQTCYKTMCPLCYSETNVHIAFKHKANLTNFYKRIDNVIDCIDNHNLCHITENSLTLQCYCDICNESIKLLNDINNEGDTIPLYSYGKDKVKWYTNRTTDNDICIGCSDTEEGKEFIDKNKLKIMIFYPLCYHMDFGSILDWIPVYVSCSSDFILYNANPDSKHHKRLAYCDNDNGFNIFYMDEIYRLDNDMEIEKMNARILECIDYTRTVQVFRLPLNEYSSF